ncbi:MAG: hypothetical protein ACTSYW_10495 [Candidatus Heimdallarchaeota archaeon]
MRIRYIKNTNEHNINDIIKVSDEYGLAEIKKGVAVRCLPDGSPDIPKRKPKRKYRHGRRKEVK